MSDRRVVVGATGESSDATGINGDQHNGYAYGSGAAYVFDLDGPDAPCQWYCGSEVDRNRYIISSGLVLGGTFVGSVGFSSPQVGALIAGYASPLTFPFLGQEGLVDATQPELMGFPAGFGAGHTTITLAVPNDPSLVGIHLYTQAATFGGGWISLTCAYDCTAGY